MKPVFLVQNETTVGLVSPDAAVLLAAKPRAGKKGFLRTLPDLAALKNEVRVPVNFRGNVRRSKKITYIYPQGVAIRVILAGEYRRFLRRWGGCFATSANQSGSVFDREWAEEKADIIVENAAGFREGVPSRLVRIGKRKHKRLR